MAPLLMGCPIFGGCVLCNMNILPAQPDCPDTRFAVVLAGKQSAQASDLAQYVVQPWLGWWSLVAQQVGGLNFVRIEEQIRVQSGAGSSQPHQISEDLLEH